MLDDKLSVSRACKVFTQKIFVAALVSFLIITPSQLWAQNVLIDNSLSHSAIHISRSFLGLGLPLTPLVEKQFDLHVGGGYFSYNLDRTEPVAGHQIQHLSGGGGAASLLYAFNESVGVSVLGTYFNGNGSHGFEYLSAQTSQPITAVSGHGNANGSVASLNLVVDPWPDKQPDGFRLPLTIGLNYMSARQKSEITQPDATLATTRKLDAPGFTAGASPQWTVFSFRLVPFFVTALPFGKVKDECSATGSGRCTPPVYFNNKYRGFYGTGIGITYVPWNLGFRYVAPVDELRGKGDTAIYSLSWSQFF